MKRTAQATLGLLVVILFSAVVSAAPLKVKVTKIKGNVMVMKAGTSDWVKATDNMSLKKGAQVKTASGGSCILAWENGNVVKLNELSSLAIEESNKEGAAEKTAVNVKNGKMYAKVGKLTSNNSDFSIKTPTAVAGVRGSEIVVTADMGASSFQVIDGAFAVESEGQEVVIEQNFQVEVTAGEAPPPPMEISMDDLEDLKSEAEEIKADAADIELEFEDDEGDEEGDDTSLEGDDEEEDGSTDEEDMGDDEELLGEDMSEDALDSIDEITDQEQLNDIIDELYEFLPGTGGAVIIIE